MKKWLLALIAVLLATAPTLEAVGTATTVRTVSGNVTILTTTWVSTAGGAVSANTIAVSAGSKVMQVKFVPDSGGTQPTDLYDATIVDSASIDVIAGGGANLSNAAGKIVTLTAPVYVSGGTLDVVIANAGNAKGGTVTIWVSR